MMSSEEVFSVEGGVRLVASMWRIRCFEEGIRALFARNLIRGSTHLCTGQEAVSVGACEALRAGDTMTCTYRGHGAVLAMGAPLDRCFGEMLGKAEGLCRGKGGSMHLADLSVGALGSFAIVGANLPVTVGSALAAQHTGSDAVAVAFFGDGATNIGAFHESLNLAAVWGLPAVFVCENNLYGEYSPLRSTTPLDRLADRAAAYGMEGVQVDGNDVRAVHGCVTAAVSQARRGDGPTLIEALTYRHYGHSRTDPGTYRPDGELEAWMERDPIARLEAALREAGCPEDRLTEVRLQVETEVDDARQRALGWDDPEPAEVDDDVWAS